MTITAFHGDLVSALVSMIIAPKSLRDAIQLVEDEDPVALVAVVVTFSILFTGSARFGAWLCSSVWCSRVAFLAGLFQCYVMDLHQWPAPGKCIITVQLQAIVVTGILANLPLSFREKIIRLVLLFLVGSYVSLKSPFSVYYKDTLPILGSTLAVAIALLSAMRHFSQTQQRKELPRIDVLMLHGSRWVLSAMFIYYTFRQFMRILSDPSNASDYMTHIIKATIIACMGVAATGAFQNEIYYKEQLERSVEERTKKIHQQSQTLHMVNMALQASETAIAITDSARCIIWTNAAFERLCNKQKHEIEMSSLTDVLDLASKKDRSNLAGSFDMLKSMEDEIHVGTSIFNLQVSPFADKVGHSSTAIKSSTTASTSTSTHKNNKNTNNSFLVVFKDITANRARERAEHMANEDSMRTKAMADSMVTLTHELRTPLQGIMGLTSLLLDNNHQGEGGGSTSDTSDELSTDALDSLKLIMASSSLLLNLINNLLDVKKATANMMEEFLLTNVLASGSIKDSIDFCMPLASISDVNIVTEYKDTQHAAIKANPLRLQQMLINLLSNGIKYAGRNSDIRIGVRSGTLGDVDAEILSSLASSRDATIETKKTAAENNVITPPDATAPVLIFSVSDSGPGIALHQADRLFRRFAQLDDKPKRSLGGTKGVGQPSGTGLGLHLCHIFVQRMNGHIWAFNNNIDDTKRGGATFSFCLPLVSNNKQNQNNNTADSGGVPQQSSVSRPGGGIFPSIKQDNQSLLHNRNIGLDTRQLRVLLVDDVLINRKVFNRMLKKIGVRTVLITDSGANALAELSKNPYDLVITDLQMPGMTGTELSEAITAASALGSYEKRPVVVGLTADTSNQVAGNCAASGMADVLFKPIAVAEMAEYLKTTVGKLRAGVWYTDETQA